MTVVHGYATKEALKAYMGNKAVGFEDNPNVDLALETSARDVDALCRRRFWKDDAASDRVFYPDNDEFAVVGDDRSFPDFGRGGQIGYSYRLRIHDCYDLVSLTIDGTPVDLDDYDLEPLNGIRGGIEGWPVTSIAVPPTVTTACLFSGRCVANGKWGWASVPSPVVTASLMLAAEKLKAGEVPFGIAAAGETALRLGRINPLVLAELKPYQNKRRGLASVPLS